MGESSTTAVLVGVILTLAELIKWILKKYSKGEETLQIELNHENARQLRETYEKISFVEKGLEDMRDMNSKLSNVLRDISECMKKVSETQLKMTELIEKIDRRQEVTDAVNKALLTNSIVKAVSDEK